MLCSEASIPGLYFILAPWDIYQNVLFKLGPALSLETRSSHFVRIDSPPWFLGSFASTRLLTLNTPKAFARRPGFDIGLEGEANERKCSALGQAPWTRWPPPSPTQPTPSCRRSTELAWADRRPPRPCASHGLGACEAEPLRCHDVRRKGACAPWVAFVLLR